MKVWQWVIAIVAAFAAGWAFGTLGAAAQMSVVLNEADELRANSKASLDTVMKRAGDDIAELRRENHKLRQAADAG